MNTFKSYLHAHLRPTCTHTVRAFPPLKLRKAHSTHGWTLHRLSIEHFYTAEKLLLYQWYYSGREKYYVLPHKRIGNNWNFNTKIPRSAIRSGIIQGMHFKWIYFKWIYPQNTLELSKIQLAPNIGHFTFLGEFRNMVSMKWYENHF